MTEGKPLNLEIKNQPKLQWPMVFSLRPPGCKIIEGHFCSALRFFIVPIVFQQDLQWQYHLWFYIGHWTKDVKYAKKQFMMLISSKLTVVDENQPILWDGLALQNAIAGYSFWYNFRSDNGWITEKPSVTHILRELLHDNLNFPRYATTMVRLTTPLRMQPRD